MPQLIPIPRNEAGNLAVLRYMAGLARASVDVADFLAMAMIGGLDGLDYFLRSNWTYDFKPIPEIQDLRTPDYLIEELAKSGTMTGACADAATLASAIALAGGLNYNWPIAAISICRIRMPNSRNDHIFTTITEFDGQVLRIDPTAPADADYSGAPIVCVRV
jgi:hypothetical protein